MLLIPDIHINHKYTDQIIFAIDTYISDYSDDNDIVFLGDYIYMFNLDNKAIHKLLDIIIKRFHNGKNIYILAGNHDRIGSEFVYHQSAAIFNILNKHTDNQIHFITEPTITLINNKKTLFLPYMITQNFDIHDLIDNTSTNIGDLRDNLTWELSSDVINQNIHHLINHKNHNHQISWLVNLTIQNTLSQYDDIDIIHHYYTADINLPAIKSRFSYSDVAIMPDWIQDNRIRNLISWHIHNSFQISRYFCAGSLRHTTGQESDQIKFLRRYDNLSNTFDWQAIYINPYINLDLNVAANPTPHSSDQFNFWLFETPHIPIVSDLDIMNQLKQKYIYIQEQTGKLFDQNTTLSFWQYDPKKVTINLNTDYNYEDLQNILTEDIRKSISDIKIKKKHKNNKIDQIDISNLSLEYSYASRQQIAKKYISDKYWDRSDIYFEYLKKMNIEI